MPENRLPNITASNVLVRSHSEFPSGLNLTTEKFDEGWDLMLPGGLERLSGKFHERGWNFIEIDDRQTSSGVGDTSQEAIAGALKRALKGIGAHCDFAEINKIETMQYEWFFLASLTVSPYRIDQGSALPASGETNCFLDRSPTAAFATPESHLFQAS